MNTEGPWEKVLKKNHVDIEPDILNPLNPCSPWSASRTLVL